MRLRNSVVAVIGLVLALWMGAGRWVFGVGGEFTWWYVPLITVPYALLQLWMVNRLHVAADRGRRAGRAPFVALALSWVCAVGFGLTAPDRVDGELTTLMTHFGGEGWHSMAVALSNPFGIVAITALVISLVYAHVAGRDPKPEEDEEWGGTMVEHPLKG